MTQNGCIEGVTVNHNTSRYAELMLRSLYATHAPDLPLSVTLYDNASTRLHGERGGVVVGTDRHPAGVRGDVVDAVRVGLAQLRVREVVHIDPRGAPWDWSPGRPALWNSPDQLLLGVHADHRRTRPPGDQRPAALR